MFLFTYSFYSPFCRFLNCIVPKKDLAIRVKQGYALQIIFLIEPIKICDDLNDENQYLCLQLNFPNQIKCHKNHIVYLKLILLLSGDKTTANSIRSSEKELEKF